MKRYPQGILLEKLLNDVEAFSLHSFLDAHGIPVHLNRRANSSAMGEIPFLETATELYLTDEDYLERARELIQQYRAGNPGVRGAVWTCPQCGETHEPQFGECWNCGTTRP